MKERAPTTTASISEESFGEDAKRLATILTASPNLRAKLFANPTKIVGKQIPRRKYWDYGIDPHWIISHPVQFYERRHSYRARLAKGVLEEIADGVTAGTLSSSVNTDAVFEEYFEPIARASQRSFNGVFGLSLGAFLAGCALIGAGIWIAVDPPSSGNSTLLASVFGATGAVSALASIYATVIKGISNATSEHARLRVVLTGFATEIGQLRAYAEVKSNGSSLAAGSLDSVEMVNVAIRTAMDDATNLIPIRPEADQQKSTGDSLRDQADGAGPTSQSGESVRNPEAG